MASGMIVMVFALETGDKFSSLGQRHLEEAIYFEVVKLLYFTVAKNFFITTYISKFIIILSQSKKENSYT